MSINFLTKKHLNVKSVNKRIRFDITINKNNELSNNKSKYFAIIVLIVIANKDAISKKIVI